MADEGAARRPPSTAFVPPVEPRMPGGDDAEERPDPATLARRSDDPGAPHSDFDGPGGGEVPPAILADEPDRETSDGAVAQPGRPAPGRPPPDTSAPSPEREGWLDPRTVFPLPSERGEVGGDAGTAHFAEVATAAFAALVTTRVIAIANQKGGVGKSTTAVNLGACLAEAGKSVLVIDLDPQGNASTGLGIDHTARESTTYHVLLGGTAITDAVVPTEVPNLFALPSTIDLAGAEIELVSQLSREGRLARAVDAVRGRFEFVLLDCPPSLGLLTVNALTAADELIVPIQCEYYALEGLGQLLRNVRLVQQNVNRNLRLSGIVLTMFDSRTKLSEQVVSEVRGFFGPRVYDAVIPRSVRLSEAPGYGQPITVYDPSSRGARAYRELAREVLVRPVEEGLGPVDEERVAARAAAPRTPVEPSSPGAAARQGWGAGNDAQRELEESGTEGGAA